MKVCLGSIPMHFRQLFLLFQPFAYLNNALFLLQDYNVTKRSNPVLTQALENRRGKIIEIKEAKK